jgi:outer membrane lipoprotein-sorting protein
VQQRCEAKAQGQAHLPPTQIAVQEKLTVANRNRLGLGAVVAGLAVIASAIAVQAQNPLDAQKQFSATVVMSGMPANNPMAKGDMKVYRSGDKIRSTLGAMGYMVMDLTEHTNYMVMNGMCMQMNATGQQNPFAQAAGATIDRSPAGTDTVDGHSCKVENLTVTPQNGKATKMKVWEADDLHGFPIKIEMQSAKGPITLQYKDISLDAPPASLFTHPDNCRQMGAMPGAPQ